MRIAAAQRRSVIWIDGIDGDKRTEYPLPAAVVERIAELERLAAADRLPKAKHAVRKALEHARRRAEFCSEQLASAEDSLDALVCGLLDRALPDIESIAPGLHDCEESPTGECAYDHTNDPSSDDCLFCHEPHERK